jgi:hypothetical protein
MCGLPSSRPQPLRRTRLSLWATVDDARTTQPAVSRDNGKFSTIPNPYYSCYQILIMKEKRLP